jgi:hypothetical protein
MRRRRAIPHSFIEQLQAEKARIEAALETAAQGKQRDSLVTKLRQIEIAIDIDGWSSSAKPHS